MIKKLDAIKFENISAIGDCKACDEIHNGKLTLTVAVLDGRRVVVFGVEVESDFHPLAVFDPALINSLEAINP